MAELMLEEDMKRMLAAELEIEAKLIAEGLENAIDIESRLEMEADLEAEEREMQLELEKELREIDKSFSKSGNKCRFHMEGSCKFGDKCRNEHAGWDVVERAEIADARFKPPSGAPSTSLEEEPEIVLGEGDIVFCDRCQSKKKKMRTVMDVVNRIWWDGTLNPDEFRVGYLDRFDGMMEEEYTAFDWSDVTTVDDWETFCIPKHRVYYFKQKDEIVWDRRTRLDKLFDPTSKLNDCKECMAAQKSKLKGK